MKHSFHCGPGIAAVQTTKGTIRGYEYDGILTFKGVPYARAERFHAPQPLDPWEGEKVCTDFGFVCPLLDLDLPDKAPSGELAVPHRYWPMSENCQNLNIWTPGLDDKKRPVLFWMHGGGFEAGSSIEQSTYDGDSMAKYGDVVMVSVNHRLNVLGYCDLSDFGEEYENSGNAGTDDLIAALQWVHDNIAAFGGDPENVMIFGQSGGGAKVTTLLQSPAADGLYAKGLNMSGVVGPILADAAGSGADLARAMMKELGFSQVKQLETCPVADLINAYVKVRPALRAAGKYVGGCPHPNAHYAGDPVANGFRRETSQIPLLVGSVYGEFLAFGRRLIQHVDEETDRKALTAFLGEDAVAELEPLFKKAYPERPLADLPILDMIFRGSEIPYIAERSALNKCTWAYMFNQNFEMDGGKCPWHCSDIAYVFHNCALAPATQQEGVEELEAAISDTVLAFARTSDPNNARIPEWKPSTPGQENMLILDGNIRTAVNHDLELIPAFAKWMGPVMQKMMASIMGDVQH